MTELNRVVRRFAHDDKFVDLLGGLHAAIARIDAVLARYAVPAPDAAATASCPELVDAMLGVIAIRDRLASTLIGNTSPRDVAQLCLTLPQESLLR